MTLSMPPAVQLPASGSGPGVLLMAPGAAASLNGRAAYLAGEGYVTQPVIATDRTAATAALDALSAQPALHGRLAAIASGAACRAAVEMAADRRLAALVFYDSAIEPEQIIALPCPVVLHQGIAETSDPDRARRMKQAAARRRDVEVHLYPDARPGFGDPDSPDWNPYVAGIAFSRSLELLRRELGPHYNLGDLWDRHVECEFVLKDATENMKTMVAEPYVNHVPTMTGGVGHDLLKRFYTYHFINQSPPDRKVVPISRTIGVDRVIEEKVFCFTHTTELDWMLPGIKPTGKYVEIPLIVVISFHGDKLYNEHIYWDQASVLAQLGLLDPTGLPIAGVEQARKMLDKSRPSNTLMKNWRSSEGKPI